MSVWISSATDHLWQGGLAAIPLILVAAAVLAILPCRPSTRHLIWLMVLVWPVIPPLLPGLQNPWSDAIPQEELPVPPTHVETAESVVRIENAALDPELESQVSNIEMMRQRHPGDSDPSASSAPQAPFRAAMNSEGDYESAIVPSPRSGALAASARPELLAQPRGAAGLPPTELQKRGRASARTRPDSAREALTRTAAKIKSGNGDLRPGVPEPAPFRTGPTCPLPPAPPPLCPGDPLPFPGGAGTLTRLNQPTPSGDADAQVLPNELNSDKVVAIDFGTRLGAVEIGQSAQDPHPASEPAILASPFPEERAPLVGEGNVATTERQRGGLEQWAAVILRVRDDLALLPPLPREVWLAGSLAVLLIGAVRVGRSFRLLNHSEPAPSDVLRIVAHAAKAIGLRRPPEVRMLGGCVSPMVWCFMRPRLLLPQKLWSDLDEVGRKAVVMHELAHLKRRDHWVLWTEGLIGCLYWWHPAVWWVRRRLRLEAEFCCDAWVTTLLPRTRRAYAHALLRTRQYLGEGSGTVPVLGMGITSGRAKRFARRLTMVMTATTKPGASFWGVSLVLLLATSGWLASPARSCPNKENDAKACSHAKPCDKASDCDHACEKDKACKELMVQTGSLPAKGATSFEQHMADRARAELPSRAVVAPMPPGASANWALASDRAAEELRLAGQMRARGVGNQERISELQAQLEQLGRQIEELSRQAGQNRGPAAPTPPAPPARPAPRTEWMTPAPPKAPPPPAGLTSPRAVVVPAPHGHGPQAFFTHAPKQMPKPGQTWADIHKGEVEWRTYKLSKGKLEDFTKFMVRQDVPVLVRPKSGAIEIQATPAQHALFNAFFQMVDPSEERAEAGLFAPMLAFGAGHEGFFAHGAGIGRGGANAGLGMGGPCGDCANCQCGKCEVVRKYRADAEKIRHEARQMAGELRAKAQGEAARIRGDARDRAREVRDRLRQESRRIRVEAENQEELIRALESQAEELRDQAERIRERADRIRERAEDVRERKQEREEEGDNGAGGAFQMHMETLELNADALVRQAESFAAKAAEVLIHQLAVEKGAALLEDHADEVGRRAEAIDELSDSIEGLEAGPELAMSIAELASEFARYADSDSFQAESQRWSELLAARTAELMAMPGEEGWQETFDRAVEAAMDAMADFEFDEGGESEDDLVDRSDEN